MLSARPPAATGWLAFSGIVPFLVLALMAVTAVGDRTEVIRATVAYTAVLLSFVGGIRWGAELIRAPFDPSVARLAASAMPPMLGWAALMFLPPALALGVLLIAGLAHVAWDVMAARAGLLPPWTARLRVLSTVPAAVCMGIVLAVAA